MELIQTKLSTSLGPFYLLASPRGLVQVSHRPFQKVPRTQALQKGLPSHKILLLAITQIEEYFEGRRMIFEIPLDLQQGTNFQKIVWQNLRKIPFGKTISYAELARRIQSPKAVRAVGSANGKNPFLMIIPCHRVIASSGELGGFSAGLALKKKLLDHEKRFTTQSI
ncbi:MAG: methylated-DNA--[protein]-cysteine S-methyltransferase [Bdellovibrionales bacterium]